MPNQENRISLLLLEDNQVDAELMLHGLARTDWQLEWRVAGSRKEFLASIDESVPDVILADYSLPQFTAIDAMRILRERGLSVPLIVVTGSLGDEMAAECIKQGAQDYLVKDRLGRLPQAVQQAIEVSRLERNAVDQQRRLLESERRFRTLAETIPQMVWTADGEGRREYCNARWYDYTGMPETADRDSALWWAEWIHEDDRADCLHRWNHSLYTGAPFQAECRVRRAADESYRWFLCRAFADRDRGKPVRWFGTWTDIDDEKKKDEALRQQQKMDSVGLLAAGVAHDFNNLLAGILGGASLVSEQMESNHPARAMLDVVITAGERASQLTQQLLAYGGKAQVSRQPVFLARLLPETCELLTASIARNVVISCTAEPDLPAVMATPSQMQQVFMNLVINASDAIGERAGSVDVRASALTLDPAASEEWWPGEAVRLGRYVLVAVRDNGSGMDEATRLRIFDPFFTTKITGRGLGLAAVAGIVRGYNGAISVASRKGEGTTFRVLLPAISGPVAAPAEALAGETRSASELTVLIVDDEELVRKTFAAMVGQLGAKTILASDGASAVKIAAEKRDELSMVVLDVNMPGQSLLETVKGLREAKSGVPILLATGYSSLEVDAYVKQFGRIRFLPKPFKSANLKQAVAELVGLGSEAD